jgi:hypothetical protein
MTWLLVLGLWLIGLTVWVWLKARQPKWQYPSPPTKEETHERHQQSS